MRFSELEGARIGVWGLGREIASFARQVRLRLPRARIAVVAHDGPEPTAGALREAGLTGVRLVTGADATAALVGCEAIVRSPGVPVHRAELRALREAGRPVTTPTSLWLAERGGRRVIGVTGTKGKSTTAALTRHLARSAGVDAHLAGNIGAPALDLLDEEDQSAPVVLELSSYQIADLHAGPEVAVVTNLYREHLDWHGSEQAYRADKLRLLGLPGVRAMVMNARDEDLATHMPGAVRDEDLADARGAGGTAAAGAASVAEAGAMPSADAPDVRLFATAEGWEATPEGASWRGELRVPAAAMPLPGAHNLLNLCAALTALEALGEVPAPRLPGALEGFAGLAHRLQTIAGAGGATWVDDSISTTPESTIAALDSFPGRPVVLIAGGQDRGQDFAELARALATRGAATTLVGIPTTGPRLVQAVREAGLPEERSLQAADLAGAVVLARSLLCTLTRQAPGEDAVVLLSPAAPSYDSFRDFEDRGERFQGLARADGHEPR